MAGFDNGILNALNWDFRGVQPVIPQSTEDGDLPIGANTFPNVRKGKISCPDGSVTINNLPGAIQLIGTPATTSQIGSTTFATNSETIAGIVTNKATTPDDLKAKLGAQTANLVAVGNGTNQSLNYFSFISSDGTILINPDAVNKRFDFKAVPAIPSPTKANFKAYYNANTATTIGIGADYVLSPNIKAWDDANNFNTATSTFTANVAGKYKFHILVRAFSLSIGLASNARVQTYALSSSEAGVAEDRLFSALISLNSSYVSVGDTTTMNLALNQTVQFHLIISNILGTYGVSGGALTSLTTTTISGWQIS